MASEGSGRLACHRAQYPYSAEGPPDHASENSRILFWSEALPPPAHASGEDCPPDYLPQQVNKFVGGGVAQFCFSHQIHTWDHLEKAT